MSTIDKHASNTPMRALTFQCVHERMGYHYYGPFSLAFLRSWGISCMTYTHGLRWQLLSPSAFSQRSYRAARAIALVKGKSLTEE